MWFFTGFLTKLTNMITKIQSITYMNVQKFNPGFTGYFNIGNLDVNSYCFVSSYDRNSKAKLGHSILSMFLLTERMLG